MRIAKRAIFVIFLFAVSFPVFAEKPEDFKKKGTSGNPIFEGLYADPEAVVYGDEYWIYPTSSNARDNDLLLDAFSSKDLVHWEKHALVLDIKDVKWAKRAIWAPAALHANDKYYLFFSANDIQSDKELGGIGVAVSEKPSGPFVDALGKPLIDKFHNGAQPIDQFVFRDDDGQSYMYYGGWGHCNVAKLKPDLIGFASFDDGTVFKEITPEKYVEGPFLFKRNAKYYLMWSEGGWGGPDYCVAYGMADSPLGPFKRIGKVLEKDPQVAVGPGHHSVIPVPGSDQWYIVYHRRPLTTKEAVYRQTCIDLMQFDKDGKIQPVKMTFEGVKRATLPSPEKKQGKK
jgi:beta-xylosidase